MLSLYFHIPFCAKNCPYCSFSVVQEPNEKMIQDYLEVLHKEIEDWWKSLSQSEIKTIYFWWWTPNLIWADEILKIIHHCENIFDCENVWEVSFECNPFPQDQIYDFIKTLQKNLKKYPRVRFSFWIQSLDNWVLENAGRPYTFPGMVDFLRWLRDLKQETTVFNFDFMAFWVFNKTKKWDSYLWTPAALEFFQDFIDSGFADSFSLYMLELFEHQKWKKWQPLWINWNMNQLPNFWTEDEIYEEFDILKNMILDWWYKRYEISNFSTIGKSSIHNRVYREMENYLWLGLSASSFIRKDSPYFEWVKEKIWLKDEEWLRWVRFTNTSYFPKYLWWESVSESSIQVMNEKDYLIESFFLWLRTDMWVKNVSEFSEVLVDNYEVLLNQYQEEWLLFYENDRLILSDSWFDVYNWIVTNLLKEV